MRAFHPKTKKEIRILQTDPSLWKEKKTLAFGFYTALEPWDTIGISSNDPTTFSLVLKPITLTDLKQRSQRSRLVFIKKEGNPSVESSLLRENRIQNILCLEELKDLYPHLGAEWDGTLDDALVLIAALLRYRCLARMPGKTLTDRGKQLGLQLESSATPAPLYWITQYYQPPVQKRKKEIDLCLRTNLDSKCIDHILLLNEKTESLPHAEPGRVTQRVIGHRLTYWDVIEAIQTLPDNAIVSFANADICIDDHSWKHLWSVDLSKTMLALLRWDVPASGNIHEATLFGPRADSQDTWVVRVADVKATFAARATAFQGVKGIPFGQMGCDNAFAMEMLKERFRVINPARTLKTYHMHASATRSYDPENVVDRPAFLYIHPTGFHDVEPLTVSWPEKTVVQKRTISPLTRTLEGPGAQRWLETINRTLSIGETAWTLRGTHVTKGGTEVLLGLQNVMETENGLCYDQTKMYIGTAEEAQKEWSQAELRSLSPSLVSKEGLIIPVQKDTMKSRENYILQYITKVLWARKVGGFLHGEFLCPESKEFIDALQVFDWGLPKIPVIKYETDQQIFCQKAICMPVSDVLHTTAEDVQVLRESVRGWEETPRHGVKLPTIVLVEDGDVLTTESLREMEDVLEQAWTVRVVYPGRTSAERMWDVMRGAHGIVFSSNSSSAGWGWNWLLPRTALAIEVIHEGKEAYAHQGSITMSSAAGLQHLFVNSVKEVLHVLHEEVEKTKPTTHTASVPTLWLPRADLEGYFAHAGDSFREMAKLWGQKGLVHVKEHPTATMCWWGSVGQNGVLLYDRPTHEWRLAAPLQEKSCRGALYGNPTPPEGVPNHLPWFFWPRRPALVEELVQKGIAETSWDSRVQGPVFYGKIENKVQEKRRTGAKQPDWSKACPPEHWVMVKGVETKYPLTQQQYLERLAQARFGLCLPGYGWKCHREVECMAMGCVPLVAPDVDMDSYANPPVHGVHYLRVETPEEAAGVAKAMPRERWEEMSAACKTWWRENASCEGSFQLTKSRVEKLSSE